VDFTILRFGASTRSWQDPDPKSGVLPTTPEPTKFSVLVAWYNLLAGNLPGLGGNMETAAAILTKIIFDNNTGLRSKLSAAGGNVVDFGGIILPFYRGILEQLRREAPQR